ncbi:MAG: FAD-dependent oxidoreductase [Methylibium sp. NZG]|nr:MAG: FAD-dependent oxidoreductase [Methylibium sp. NZG]
MDRVDCVIVGAGVVGLALARAIAMRGLQTLVLESEAAFGQGVSSRNSEVIHAGLHGALGWRKATACIAGRRMLYDYAAQRGIAHCKLGKLLVAHGAEEDALLLGLLGKAQALGVEGLQMLTAAQAMAREPALRCTSALLSPESGVIDVHGLMLTLLGDAEAHGATLVCRSPFEAAERVGDDWHLKVAGDGGGDAASEPFELRTRWLVNSAGLQAQAVAARIAGYPAARIPRAHWGKGNYLKLQGRAPFTHLIYPVPVQGGLGVHLTLDLQGQAKFGPDVEWVDTLDYRVDPRRGDAFYAEVRRYWPGLPDGALLPDYAGIRPKLYGPGEPARDFVLDGPAEHGLPGLVQLFGIESPGVTSSLALADEVVAMLG